MEWQQTTDFKISRINFEVNNMPWSDEYSNEKYKFINGKYSFMVSMIIIVILILNNLERIPVLTTLL